uniref:C2H2-type domain-containing protein n=1 Tax=Oryza punctata TaxID=4537 RepID=A0A0E0JS05_ORYPU
MGEEKSSSSGSDLRRRPDPPPQEEEEEEIEEGEIHRGGGGGGYYDSGSETEDDDDRYVFQSRRDDDDDDDDEEGMHPTSKRRRLEDIIAETRGALPLPSPTPSSGSEGTISDHGDGIVAGASAAADAAPVAREAFPCHICNKEFGSRKAVHGHMRVHQAEKDKEPSLHLALGWASTGKRGANGNARAVTVAFAPMEQVVDDDDTRAIVLAPAQPPPPMLATAVARTNLDEPSAVMVAAEANHPNQVVEDNHHLPAAAPYVSAAHHRAPVPEAGQGGPYRCKVPGCNMEYRTHQGLGGHVAGHINREKQAVAAAAAAQGGSGGGLGGGRPEGRHPCKKCGQEFLTGVALGGHMRKHYEPKKKHDDLVLTLSVALPPTPAPAPAIAGAALPPVEIKVEVAEHEAEPVPAPAPAPPPAEVRRNIVRIFGVDIEKPADEEEQDGGSDV